MERMTIRNSDGTVSQPTNTSVEQLFYRLAAYEDTGLSPEAVRVLRDFCARHTIADIETLNRVAENEAKLKGGIGR